MTRRSGHCLCGAVRFTATSWGSFGVCHCEQCRRWAGSALFAADVAEGDLDVQGAEHIRSFRSSDWATRSFCGTCGSVLWYRYDKGVDGAGAYEVCLGLLDDANGFALKREIFADEKPDSWALDGQHDRLTRSECLAMFGSQSDGA